MKKVGVFILLQIICAAGFSENPRWKVFGTPIPARADLDVRWDTPPTFVDFNVPTNKWPSKMWVYRTEPREFSHKAISNLMLLGPFTEKEIAQQDANGIMFRSTDGSTALSVSFSSGSIRYDTPEPHYILKPGIFKDVPETKDLPKLTKSFLKKSGINPSEIQKNTNGAPLFYFSDLGYEYLFDHAWTTNTWGRLVVCRRSVDGVEVIGNVCRVQFGEQGKISKIDLSWPGLKRYKSAETLRPQTVIQLLRQGNAYQGLIPMGFGEINWQTVKSVTIKQAWPCYFAGDSELYPFLDLWTTVETPQGNVEIEIDCPIIDETRL
jgi:hypothetical protein